MLSFDVIIFHSQQMLSFSLVHILCYHSSYHLMLSFFTVSKCYHFNVIIFPCTYFVLSFTLSFDVIIYCYHFPPFFFFLKTWHTPQIYILEVKNHLWKNVSLLSSNTQHLGQRQREDRHCVLFCFRRTDFAPFILHWYSRNLLLSLAKYGKNKFGVDEKSRSVGAFNALTNLQRSVIAVSYSFAVCYHTGDGAADYILWLPATLHVDILSMLSCWPYTLLILGYLWMLATLWPDSQLRGSLKLEIRSLLLMALVLFLRLTALHLLGLPNSFRNKPRKRLLLSG